jgi:hypothetical protein
VVMLLLFMCIMLRIVTSVYLSVVAAVNDIRVFGT